MFIFSYFEEKKWVRHIFESPRPAVHYLLLILIFAERNSHVAFRCVLLSVFQLFTFLFGTQQYSDCENRFEFFFKFTTFFFFFIPAHLLFNESPESSPLNLQSRESFMHITAIYLAQGPRENFYLQCAFARFLSKKIMLAKSLFTFFFIIKIECERTTLTKKHCNFW